MAENAPPLSEKQKEILQFLEFYRGIPDKSPHMLREIDDYIDGLSHQEVAFLHRHRARLDDLDKAAGRVTRAASPTRGGGT